MNKQVPYIGSQISLVSKSEIRYVGTLYNINIEDSTVALHNVKVHGTEGRRKGGPQIPANEEIFEYVIFRGTDIKDLVVCAPPVKEKEKSTEPAFVDPAIISSKQSADLGKGQNSKTDDNIKGSPQLDTEPLNVQSDDRSGGNPRDSTNSWRNRRNVQNTWGSNRHNKRDHRHFRRGYGRNRGGAIPGMGKHLEKVRMRGGGGNIESDLNTEFDFASMNEKFDKEAELAKLSLNENTISGSDEEDENAEDDETATAGYDKSSSFFDTISCDMNDRAAGKRNLGGAEERQLNSETFGAVGLQHRGQGRGRRYHRGRGRGRGRGGGFYRGRGGSNNSRWNGNNNYRNTSNGN
uniref:FFD box profile domain-containing protein n=1 Tax=Aplanochytrium stocchinoi TaxID=215587 RepID=A0A7S3PJE4_9STRA